MSSRAGVPGRQADAAGGRRVQAGDQAQQRALAAAAAADDGDELAGGDVAGRCRAAPRCSPKRLAHATDAERQAVAAPGAPAHDACLRRELARLASSAREGVRRAVCMSLSAFLEGGVPGERRRSSSARGAVGELAEQRVDQDARARRRRSAGTRARSSSCSRCRTAPRSSRPRSASAT